MAWLNEASPAPMTMQAGGRELAVERIDSAALAQRFGFAQQPRG
jgi:hypothetical protein